MNRRDNLKGIVDRFEGDFVVIEIDGKTQDVNKRYVDPNVKAGDVVELIEGLWRTNKKETEARSKHIKKLMDDLWVD